MVIDDCKQQIEKSQKNQEKTVQEVLLYQQLMEQLQQTEPFEEHVLTVFKQQGLKPPHKFLIQMKREHEVHNESLKAHQKMPEHIMKMSVAQLKEELKKDGVAVPSRAVRADLQALFRLHTEGKLNNDNNNIVENDNNRETKSHRKRRAKRRKISSDSESNDSSEEEDEDQLEDGNSKKYVKQKHRRLLML
mmetsp:Transcript_25802/g.36291  ORF Transcript_25802/g.36291 Transcript_25802/m.36291 type:complete len:191 (+) Transcript_25802:309-881(+)